MFCLKGKKVLVLGAAGGIGRACVDMLTGLGAGVLASDLQADFSSKNVWYMPCNVSERTSVDHLFEEITRSTGELDGFVYSSGIGSSSGFTDTYLEHFDNVLSVNLRGAFYTSQKAVQLMRHGGSIILVASQKGLCGSVGSLAYNASKGGMVIMARSMALELGSQGIRVNCICPGPTETSMFQADMNNQPDSEAARVKVAASNPLNQIAQPERIAAGIVYALSDEASFMTGTEIVIDGGNIAGVRNI